MKELDTEIALLRARLLILESRRDFRRFSGDVKFENYTKTIYDEKKDSIK